MVAKCFCSTVWTSRLSGLSGLCGLSRHLDYRPLPLITVYITHHLFQGRATNSTQLIDKFFDILVTVLVSVHLKSQTNFSNFLQENVGNNLPFLTFRPWRYREKQMTNALRQLPVGHLDNPVHPLHAGVGPNTNLQWTILSDRE